MSSKVWGQGCGDHSVKSGRLVEEWWGEWWDSGGRGMGTRRGPGRVGSYLIALKNEADDLGVDPQDVSKSFGASDADTVPFEHNLCHCATKVRVCGALLLIAPKSVLLLICLSFSRIISRTEGQEAHAW